MTPQQQGFLIKAQRSLDTAKKLNQENFPEFAVSRAYYAMLYIAEAFLLVEGLSFSRHSAVIAALGERFTRSDRELKHYFLAHRDHKKAFETARFKNIS